MVEKKLRRGVSYLVPIIILATIIILLIANYLYQISSQSHAYFYSLQNLREFSELAGEESLILKAEITTTSEETSVTYILYNNGKVPVNLIRWWVLKDKDIKIISKSFIIQPGSYLDLNQTLSTLGVEDATEILFAVSVRGNIIPISAEIKRIYGLAIPYIDKAKSSVINPQPVIYVPTELSSSNFKTLINSNRVEAYYKQPTDQLCNLRATPLVVDKFDAVMAPLPALVAAYSTRSGYGYTITLSNQQSACARFIVKDLVAYNVDLKNFYVNAYVGFYAQNLGASAVDIFYITVTLRLIDKATGNEISSASQTVYYSFDPYFSMAYDTIPVTLRLDAKYLDPKYLENRYFNVEISIYVYLKATAGDTFNVKVGVHRIVFFGAEVKLD